MEVIYENYGLEEVLFLLIIIPVMLLFYYFARKGGMNRRGWFFLFTRFVLVSLIAIALASPFIAKMDHEFKNVTSITILYDKSGSMGVFGNVNETVSKFYREIKGAVGNMTGYRDSVQMKYFAEENRTDIGNVLYQETLGETKDKNLLILVSDGNNNYGKDTGSLAQLLSDANITVSAFIPMITESDVYVSDLEGEKKIPANSDYELKVVIKKVGSDVARYRLDLRLDNKLLHTSKETQDVPERKIYFTFSISSEGPHEISVEIFPETPDRFKLNNKFIKSIDVVERPNIVLMTDNKDSPLYSILSNNYDIDVVNDLTYTDMYSYDAVIVDNQPGSKFGSSVVNSLYKYIINGNGLVVIGGDKSYEKGNYYNSQFETLLPVLSTEPPKRKRKRLVVLFLIDISESTGYGLGGESKVDVEKAIAINLIEQLNPEDMVGVIAFNVDAYIISDIAKLEDNKQVVEDKIKRLRFGGGTDMYAALTKAEGMLESFSEDKVIILISDGIIKRRSRQEPTIARVEKLKEKEIKLYSVGVGFDTDENFMTRLSNAGGGQYFGVENYQRLKLEFEEKEKKEKDQYILEIYNRYHFITRNLKTPYFPSIKDHNGVTEKSIAQLLITTRDNMPILTVWRFGLGRVASLTTDNGLGWAPNLYTQERYNRLIPAMTNWVIGNLEKRKRVNIETNDIFSGENAEIMLKSEKVPVLVIENEEGIGEEVTLTQTDVDIYLGNVPSMEPGFYMIAADSSLGDDTDAIAVNYPREINELGINYAVLSNVVLSTGGRLYNYSNISELETDVLQYAKEGSFVTVFQRTPLRIYFLLAVMSLFFIDVVTRRVLEIIRLRREG